MAVDLWTSLDSCHQQLQICPLVKQNTRASPYKNTTDLKTQRRPYPDDKNYLELCRACLFLQIASRNVLNFLSASGDRRKTIALNGSGRLSGYLTFVPGFDTPHIDTYCYMQIMPKQKCQQINTTSCDLK